MNTRLFCLTLVILPLASTVLADPPPANPNSRLTTRPAAQLTTDELQDELPAALRLNLGRANEYDTVIEELRSASLLTAEEEAGIRSRLMQRNKMLRDFAEDPQTGRALLIQRLDIAEAARKRDDAEFERLRAQAKPLADQYSAVRNSGRAFILQGLSDAQLNFLVARSVRSKLTRELPLRFTAEQSAAVDAICLRNVQAMWKRDSLKDDPFFLQTDELVAATVAAVRSEVVTAEQNAALDRRAAARRTGSEGQATRPSDSTSPSSSDSPQTPAPRQSAP